MDMALTIPLIGALFGMGALTGLLAGLLGIGGGIILVPGLYYLMSALGFDDPALMHVAIGTSLAIIIPTGLSSALAHNRRGNIRFDMLRTLGPGILAGVLAGALVADALTGKTLKAVFAVAIIVLALIMLIGPERLISVKHASGRIRSSFAGMVIGTVSTLVGIGGATLSVPYMSFCGVPIHRAVGTASALGIVIAVPATVSYIVTGLDDSVALPFTIGFVNYLAWILIVPVSTIFAPFGAAMGQKLPVGRLRAVFSLLMLVVATRMIYEAFGG